MPRSVEKDPALRRRLRRTRIVQAATTLGSMAAGVYGFSATDGSRLGPTFGAAVAMGVASFAERRQALGDLLGTRRQHNAYRQARDGFRLFQADGTYRREPFVGTISSRAGELGAKVLATTNAYIGVGIAAYHERFQPDMVPQALGFVFIGVVGAVTIDAVLADDARRAVENQEYLQSSRSGGTEPTMAAQPVVES